MNNRITVPGVIKFEPDNKTRKHLLQSSWKKIAMVFIDGDICDYYAWFLNKRFNIILNKPLRGAHISFINDNVKDFSDGALSDWEKYKAKWDNTSIDIVLDLNIKTDDRSWWLNIPHDERVLLHDIRKEIGLDRPHFGLHMSIGYARPGIHEEHSEYIHTCIKKGFIL
jgi:hypothetical protein